MLELRDAKLELVQLLARDEPELACEVVQAALAELPLAALCAFIVYDAETFLAATVNRFRR